jgi:hypothetical protein
MKSAVLGMATALLVLTIPSESPADLVVVRPLSSTELLIERTHKERVQLGESLTIRSQESRRPIGFLKVTKIYAPARNRRLYFAGRIVSYRESSLIRPRDYVTKVDFTRAADDYPGQSNLLVAGSRRTSARYKPLTYQGILIGETAATLGKGESLLDVLTYYSYGLTDNFSISTIAWLNLVSPNLSLKYRVADNEVLTYSLAATATGTYGSEYEPPQADMTGSMYLDVKSNSKFISHTALKVSRRKVIGNYERLDASQLLGSSLRTGTEYIFDNWDRFLIGPEYNFDIRGVGGYLAYLFVWDHFHLSLNLTIRNVTNPAIGFDAYLPYAYAFWRF